MKATCPRCGLVRVIKPNRGVDAMCRDCWLYMNGEPTHTPELTGGHWETRGLVRVWVRHECVVCGGFQAPGTSCRTCLTWAVKNARDAEWARIRWANRGVIWDVLDTRKTSQRGVA